MAGFSPGNFDIRIFSTCNDYGEKPGMKVYGLTGGIASGKSTIAAMFVERGAAAIDADKLARDVVVPGSLAYEKVIEEFGTEILLPDRTINRARLREIVFGNAQRRHLLEDIVHPEIRREAFEQIEEFRKDGMKYCIYHAALLVETNEYRTLDGLIVISTERRQQVERLVAREGISIREAEALIRTQFPLERKLEVADYVIDNSESLENTIRQVDELDRLFVNG